MENIEIYNLVKESIDSVFFIDNFYYNKIEYENFFSSDSLSLSNFKKNNLLKEKDKKIIENLFEKISKLKIKDHFIYCRKFIQISKEDLNKTKNFELIEKYIADLLYLDNLYIEKIRFYFNSKNVKITFKTENLPYFLTFNFDIIFYEKECVFDNNKNLNLNSFRKHFFVKYLKRKNVDIKLIKLIQESKIVDLKRNIDLIRMINY
jgi:hypothetical protein